TPPRPAQRRRQIHEPRLGTKRRTGEACQARLLQLRLGRAEPGCVPGPEFVGFQQLAQQVGSLMSQVAGRDGLVMMSVAIPLDAAAHIRPLIRDNQPRDTRAKGRFLEGFLHCRRGGMWHWLKRDQGQVFQLQASRRIRQSAQPDADDREALHYADLDRVVDEIGPIARSLRPPCLVPSPPTKRLTSETKNPGCHKPKMSRQGQLRISLVNTYPPRGSSLFLSLIR